jgi:metal-sulfur cluster biosynthetic enzyme
MSRPPAEAQGPASRTEQDLRDAVERALRRIEDPCSISMNAGWSVLDLGLLERVRLADGDEIVVEIVLTDPFCPFFDKLDEIIVTAVKEETASDRVRVEVSADAGWHPGRARKGLLA